jgi:competence protein CoiA
MQFALVSGERTVPSPKLTGTCPACGSPVIAKCGTIRVHHWAHSSDRDCDPWWERETQWHRDWKNLFAKEFQEVVLFDDQTGEKHIADVRTSQQLVIEFQHSHLSPEERVSREQFYKNMVWVVDGARLKSDLPRFLEGRATFQQVFQGIYVSAVPRNVFPRTWLECATPVFFDFHDSAEATTRNGPLYCLLPGREYGGEAVIVAMHRHDFVRLAGERVQPLPLPAAELVRKVGDALIEQAERLIEQIRQQQRRRVVYTMPRYPSRGRSRRRF